MTVHDWLMLVAVTTFPAAVGLILLGVFGGDLADGLRWVGRQAVGGFRTRFGKQ